MKNKLIEADLFRYGYSGISGLQKALLIPGFRYTFVLRKLASLRKYSPLWFFFFLLKRRYGFKFGYQIPLNTQIGKGLYIGHWGIVVINENARIGKNCNLGHNITIGKVNRGKLKGSPVIGDMVWIGNGSVIVGNIHIGNNILIAPNSFVNFDVPDNSMVIGNPGKITPKVDPTRDYINNVDYLY